MAVKKKMALFLNDSQVVEKISQYLYKQLDEGLVLVSFDKLYFYFDQTNQKYTYAIEEKSFDSEYDESEYIEMFKDYGYDYIGKELSAYSGSIYYFKKLGDPALLSNSSSNEAPSYKKEVGILAAMFCLWIATDVLGEIGERVENLILSKGLGLGANLGKIVICLVLIKVIFNLMEDKNA